MNILAGLTGLMLGALAAWGLARGSAAGKMSRLRAQLQARIGYWQEEAERARTNAARVRDQAAAWAAGCQQGREDIMSLARALAGLASGTDDGPAAAD
jgi:hypothetical protein